MFRIHPFYLTPCPMRSRKLVAALSVYSMLLSQIPFGGLRELSANIAPAVPQAVAANTTELPEALYNSVLASLPANMPQTLTLGANHNPLVVVGEANSKLAQFGL